MQITEFSTSQELDDLRLRLAEFNAQAVPYQGPHYQEMHLMLRNRDGVLKGGIIAYLHNLNLLYIDTLWVDADCRHAGYGTQLLRQVERSAAQKGCRLVTLDTYSFQAPAFYLRQGYECFAVLNNCPRGHQRFYFRKLL